MSSRKEFLAGYCRINHNAIGNLAVLHTNLHTGEDRRILLAAIDFLNRYDLDQFGLEECLRIIADHGYSLDIEGLPEPYGYYRYIVPTFQTDEDWMQHMTLAQNSEPDHTLE